MITNSYRGDIDGLRAFAVSSVLLFHAFPTVIPGGFIGVDVFFVISGYLISTIIFTTLSENQFSFLEFYSRRVRRIFPALLTVLAFTLVVGWQVLFADELYQLGKHVASASLFLLNFVLSNESGYFDTAAELKPLLHLWSLSVEEQFYLVWPLIVVLIWRVGSKFVIAMTLLLLFGSFVVNVRFVSELPAHTYYWPVSRFWELLAGSALAFYGLKGKCISPNELRLQNLASVFGFGLLIAGLWVIDKSKSFPGYWAALPVLGALLLLYAGKDSVINKFVLNRRLFVFVGLISYPLYLWHWVLLAFARFYLGEQLGGLYASVLLLLSVLLAWLTYLFIERPLRFGKSLTFKTLLLIALMLVISFAGVFIVKEKGLPNRSSVSLMELELQQIAKPRETRESDGSCQKNLNVSFGGTVECLSNSPKPDVLVIGDSHAFALNGAAHLNLVDLQTVVVGDHGCLPLVGYSIYENGIDKGCSEGVVNAVDELIQSIDSISKVVIATRDPLYYLGEGFGDEGKSGFSIGLPTVEDPRRGFDYFKAGLSGLIERIELNRPGLPVTLFIDVPPLGVQPVDCIDVTRPFSSSRKQVLNCQNPRGSINARQVAYREILNDFSVDHASVALFDPIDTFCDSELCYGKREGQFMYWDDDHITTYASKVVLNQMIEKLGW